jgi:multisubunit Na+/H+ antiporter MnhB subunit
VALAATTIAFILALRTEASGHEIPGSHWLAERKGMAWLMLPFAAAGLWGTGLTALAGYAAGSFFWAQRHVHRPAPAPSAD